MLNLLLEAKIDELIQNGVSSLTWEFYDQRIRYGNTKVNVASSIYNVKDKYYEVWFKVDSTKNENIKYDVILRWYNVDKYFTDDPSKVRYSVVEKMLRDIIHKCDVRMYSSDPSFQLQGTWEGLAKNDLSIFKYNGPKGDGIWDSRHMNSGGLNNKNIHLTKHLAQIISQIDSFVPKMSQMLDVNFGEN